MTHLLISVRLDAGKMTTTQARRQKCEGSKKESLTATEFCHCPAGKSALTHTGQTNGHLGATSGFYTCICLISGLKITSSIKVRAK